MLLDRHPRCATRTLLIDFDLAIIRDEGEQGRDEIAVRSIYLHLQGLAYDTPGHIRLHGPGGSHGSPSWR